MQALKGSMCAHSQTAEAARSLWVFEHRLGFYGLGAGLFFVVLAYCFSVGNKEIYHVWAALGFYSLIPCKGRTMKSIGRIVVCF